MSVTTRIVNLDSMRARMTALYASSIALIALASSIAMTFYVRQLTLLESRSILNTSVQQVTSEIQEDGHGSMDVGEFVREQNRELAPLNVTLFAVDEHGQVVARAVDRALPPWPVPDDSWHCATTPGNGVTYVLALPWKAREWRIREIGLFLLVLSGVVTLFSAIGAWLLVGQTLSPIDRLALQAGAAATLNEAARLQAPSNDREITRLVATLNELLECQSSSAAARGRFYAAASHELRTPLQALQGHLELALSRPREAARYRDTIAEADSQTRRLVELVQSLLFLNQLEMSNTRPPVEESDLADICTRSLASQYVTISRKRLRVETSVPEEAPVSGMGNHPEVLLRNLLENAVKYTPSGGIIQVTVDAAQPQMEIFNECGPIDTESLSRLCEPFFRLDASRHSETGGNGLGLAICKAICEVNGWQLLMDGTETGLKVIVMFS